MTDISTFLKDLLSIPGLSGYEDPASEIIADKWKPFVDELSWGKLGSLHAFVRGIGPSPRPSVLIATHMDAIGLMVSGSVNGFLRITDIGGVDPRVLPGTLVTVHASGKKAPLSIPGVIIQPPDHLLPPSLASDPIPLECLFVDTGMSAEKVTNLIHVGDIISFATPPIELAGGTITAHTLDNRSSIAALTISLEELHFRPHNWDVWAVATTQEEIGMAGAASSSFELNPAIAIVVDVTHAKSPGVNDWQSAPLGKGPTISMGPNIHPALHQTMKDLADKLEIPYTLEYAPRHTGTDAFTAQVAREGIPTLVLGIPLRYMHTPVEVVAMRDIQRVGRLLTEFIVGLLPDFMHRLTWDE